MNGTGGGTGNPVGRLIDRVNAAVGRTVAWGALALVAVQFVAVVLRYVFGIGWIWVEESIVYIHATIFMAGSAFTLLHEGHVRVDIFYAEASARNRAWVDLLGTVFFLWPVSGLIIAKAGPYVWTSWATLEGSPETSGIPAVFLLKTLIPMFAGLMALQGLSMAAAAISVIKDVTAVEDDTGAGSPGPT